MRPVNAVITFVSICVSVFIASTASAGDVDIMIYILAALSGTFTGSAGNVINDYFDIEIDKINRPERVLPSNKIKPSSAIWFYCVLIVTALVLSILINFLSFVIVAGASAVIFVYSKYLKKIPLAGNFTVAFVTGFAFIFGGVAAGNVQANIFPALFAFMTNLIREIVKDIEDVKGDSAQNVFTFPAVYGNKKTKKLIMILTIILIVLTTIPYLFEIYKIEFFILAMLIINPMLIYSLKILFASDEKENLKRISSLLKLVMVIGLFAIYLGL